MRLVPVDNPRPGQVLVCLGCGERGEAARMVADLDGEAYRAYYHDPGCRPDNFSAVEPPEVDEVDFTADIDPPDDYDPTPWCDYCGAKVSRDCVCGPLADND